MRQGMAVGNQEREPLGGDLKSNIAWGLFFCRILAGINELIFRRVGTAGFAYWLPAFFGLLMPLLAANASRGPLFDPVQRQAQAWCGRVAVLLFVLWLIQLAAAQRNRGREHSQFVGCTWGCDRPRPLVELVLGLSMAFGVSHVSPPLANLMAFSALATVISIGAANVKRGVASSVAFDQLLEGQEFAADLRRHQDR